MGGAQNARHRSWPSRCHPQTALDPKTCQPQSTTTLQHRKLVLDESVELEVLEGHGRHGQHEAAALEVGTGFEVLENDVQVVEESARRLFRGPLRTICCRSALLLGQTLPVLQTRDVLEHTLA
eukprot:3255643-Pyramimonas_sp.AAC.2